MYQKTEEDRALAKVVGMRIRKARQATFPSQRRAATALGMAQAQLSKIERGMDTPGYFVLRRLMAVLEVSPETLFAPVRPSEFDDDEALNN